METVDPVVYGKVRALQDFDEDLERKKNIGIVLHGDAAHAGQGYPLIILVLYTKLTNSKI